MARFFSRKDKDKDNLVEEEIQNFAEQSSDIISLTHAIYGSEHLDDAYKAVMEKDYKSTALISLCDEINALIKAGKLADKSVGQQTPRTIALDVVKTYTLAMDDDHKEEIDGLQQTIQAKEREVLEITEELQVTKERYDLVVNDYNELLCKQASGETVAQEDVLEYQNKITELNEMIEEKNAKISELNSELENVKVEMQQLNGNLDSLAASSTGDDKIDELATTLAKRDSEIASLNNQLVKLNSDLTMAKRDAKMKVSSEEAISGFKATIDTLTKELALTTDESLKLLEELGVVKQELAVKEQDVIALRSLVDNYKKKAEIKIKMISSGNIQSAIDSGEVDTTDATENLEKPIEEVNVNDPSEATQQIASTEESTKEPSNDSISITDTQKLMVAMIEARMLAKELLPQYQNNVTFQVNTLIQHRDEIVVSDLNRTVHGIFKEYMQSSNVGQ